jgi:hypothetical protein
MYFWREVHFFIQQGLVEEGNHIQRILVSEEMTYRVRPTNPMRNPLKTHFPNYLEIITIQKKVFRGFIRNVAEDTYGRALDSSLD